MATVIALIGEAGSGKDTILKYLAKHLEELEKTRGMKLPIRFHILSQDEYVSKNNGNRQKGFQDFKANFMEATLDRCVIFTSATTPLDFYPESTIYVNVIGERPQNIRERLISLLGLYALYKRVEVDPTHPFKGLKPKNVQSVLENAQKSQSSVAFSYQCSHLDGLAEQVADSLDFDPMNVDDSNAAKCFEPFTPEFQQIREEACKEEAEKLLDWILSLGVFSRNILTFFDLDGTLFITKKVDSSEKIDYESDESLKRLMPWVAFEYFKTLFTYGGAKILTGRGEQLRQPLLNVLEKHTGFSRNALDECLIMRPSNCTNTRDFKVSVLERMCLFSRTPFTYIDDDRSPMDALLRAESFPTNVNLIHLDEQGVPHFLREANGLFLSLNISAASANPLVNAVPAVHKPNSHFHVTLMFPKKPFSCPLEYLPIGPHMVPGPEKVVMPLVRKFSVTHSITIEQVAKNKKVQQQARALVTDESTQDLVRRVRGNPNAIGHITHSRDKNYSPGKIGKDAIGVPHVPLDNPLEVEGYICFQGDTGSQSPYVPFSLGAIDPQVSLLDLVRSKVPGPFEAQHIAAFGEAGMMVNTEDDGTLMLSKYNLQCGGCEMKNRSVQESRGIICRLLSSNIWKVEAHAISKFFNKSETSLVAVPPEDAEITVYEKADGSLINLWWDARRGNWRFSTSGRLTPAADIQKLLDEIDFPFEVLQRDCNYIFELVSKENKIVVNYDRTELRAITAFHVPTGKELPFQEVRAMVTAANTIKPVTPPQILSVRIIHPDGTPDDFAYVGQPRDEVYTEKVGVPIQDVPEDAKIIGSDPTNGLLKTILVPGIEEGFVDAWIGDDGKTYRRKRKNHEYLAEAHCIVGASQDKTSVVRRLIEAYKHRREDDLHSAGDIMQEWLGRLRVALHDRIQDSIKTVCADLNSKYENSRQLEADIRTYLLSYIRGVTKDPRKSIPECAVFAKDLNPMLLDHRRIVAEHCARHGDGHLIKRILNECPQ